MSCSSFGEGSATIKWNLGCIPRPSCQRNLVESHLFVFSYQGFWWRNFFCCGLAGNLCGANDHKFSKYDGMEAMVFITRFLCSVFWTCHLNLLSPCVLCHFHEHQIGIGGNSCYARIPGGQWRCHGVDWGGHVHPSFPRGRFSNFSKSVEKILGGYDLFSLRTSWCATLVALKERICNMGP